MRKCVCCGNRRGDGSGKLIHHNTTSLGNPNTGFVKNKWTRRLLREYGQREGRDLIAIQRGPTCDWCWNDFAAMVGLPEEIDDA